MFSLLREGSPSFGVEGKIQRVKGRGGKSRELEREADIVEHCSVLRIDEDISLTYLLVAG